MTDAPPPTEPLAATPPAPVRPHDGEDPQVRPYEGRDPQVRPFDPAAEDPSKEQTMTTPDEQGPQTEEQEEVEQPTEEPTEQPTEQPTEEPNAS
jgi:hypothetical protein